MASIKADWWGVHINLDHNETQDLIIGGGVGAGLASLIGYVLGPFGKVVIAVLNLLISYDLKRISNADHGWGVDLYIEYWAATFLQWWDFGVYSNSAPAIVYANHLDVFFIGADSRVWSTWWDVSSRTWAAWFAISPGSSSPNQFFGPVAAVSRTQDHLNIFAADELGYIWSAWWDKSASAGAWSDWAKLATPTGSPRFAHSAPTVLGRNPTQLDLFVIGDSGSGMQVWWSEWSNTGWSAWSAVSPATTPVHHILLPPPPVVAVARDGGHMDVFVSDLDSNVWWSAWDAAATPPAWSPWTKVGTSLPSGSVVTALARDANHIDIFTTNGSWAAWSTTTGWSDWTNLPSSDSTLAVSAVAATSPDHLEAIGVSATDPSILVNHWDQADPVWAGWYKAAGDYTTSPPPTFASCAAVAMTPDQVYLVAVDAVYPLANMWTGAYTLSYGGTGLTQASASQLYPQPLTVVGRIAS